MNWDDRVIEQSRACEIAKIDKQRLRTWRKRGLMYGVGVKRSRWRLTPRETLLLAMLASMPQLNRGLEKRVAMMKVHAAKAEKIKADDLVMFNEGEGVNILLQDKNPAKAMRMKRLTVAAFLPVGKIVAAVRSALIRE